MSISPAKSSILEIDADDDLAIAARAGIIDLLEEAGEAGVSIRNLQTGLVRWSRGLFRLLGLEPRSDRPLLDVIEMLVHPSDRQVFHEVAVAIMPGASTLRRCDFRIVRPNGAMRWISISCEIRHDATGEPREAVHVFFDITARKDALLRLEASQQLSHELARKISNVTWSMPANGKKPMVPLWAELTGQTLSESEGDGWLDAVHPDDRESARAAWAAAFATSSEYFARYRLRRADGEFRWVVARSAPVFKQDGQLKEWVGACIDIHETPLGVNLDMGPAPVESATAISGYHLRAARGILNWSVRELAQAAQLTPAVVRRLEESGPISPDDPSLMAVRQTIEAAGAAFIRVTNNKVAVKRRIAQRQDA